MKRSFLFLFSCLLLTTTLSAQVARQYAVQLRASPDLAGGVPIAINLSWEPESGINTYTIWRKLSGDNSWGTPIAILPDTATAYADSNAVLSTSYEYKIQGSASGYSSYGYINAGMNLSPRHTSGHVLLVVDTTYLSQFTAELEQTIIDLEGDGWMVTEILVDRNDSVPDVKARLTQAYNLYPGYTKAIYLLGHVPVPYSGNLNPDGHPDHKGAWPADMYYGDFNGNWTDFSVNNTVATGSRNDNLPGDGKFDQSLMPSDIDVPVGRVDFANLPAFSANEGELIRRYLEKCHAYKHKLITPRHRALIDDHFGGFGGEAFAASAWKNFPTIVGSNQIDVYDYDDSLSNQSYLWSYGCGPGSYSSCGGVVNTSRFASDSLQSVFTILFGSYFGDWDSNNNLLRAALASGTTLTNFWSGRPHWQFHHMGMGMHIGHATLLSQNNQSLYYGNYGLRYIHIALMGDPTLRSFVLAPPSNIMASQTNISWDASPDTVDGYFIYRKHSGDSLFTLLNPGYIPITSYIDLGLNESGLIVYMVRAAKLETTPSGTFWNLSQGIFDTIISTIGLEDACKYELSMKLYPNPSQSDFWVETELPEPGIYTIEIYDIAGSLIHMEEISAQAGRFRKQFSLGLSDGVYLVRMRDRNGGEGIRKAIIQGK